MEKSHNFSGKILFSQEAKSKKLTLMSYQTEPMEAGFEHTMMSSFDFLKFSFFQVHGAFIFLLTILTFIFYFCIFLSL